MEVMAILTHFSLVQGMPRYQNYLNGPFLGYGIPGGIPLKYAEIPGMT